ncbi:MAG: acylphosphatase [Nitrospira sp.]|nr:acylphosphatase [Nitrospira sp.]
MTLKVVRAHILVKGKVQGVGFRAFVQSQAIPLNIKGWVRNCLDGAVECEAEGEKTAIEALLEHLRHGPVFSIVESVQVDWRAANRQTEGFQILR